MGERSEEGEERRDGARGRREGEVGFEEMKKGRKGRTREAVGEKERGIELVGDQRSAEGG